MRSVSVVDSNERVRVDIAARPGEFEDYTSMVEAGRALLDYWLSHHADVVEDASRVLEETDE